MEPYRRGQRIKEWREKNHHEDEDEVETRSFLSPSLVALSGNTRLLIRVQNRVTGLTGISKSQPPKTGGGGTTQGLTGLT